MSESITNEIRWSSELETYFKEIGERSQCLGIIHSHSEKMFASRKTKLELPVIVLSAITGFLSVGSVQIFQGWSYTPVVLGVSSLFVSVLNTVGSYFAWAKRQEGHRIASIQYARAYRFIQIELSLPREERMSGHDLLKKVKDDYDRLAEVSPPLAEQSIAYFQSRFKNESIAKPEEASGLTSIKIFGTPPPQALQSPRAPAQYTLMSPRDLSSDDRELHLRIPEQSAESRSPESSG